MSINCQPHFSMALKLLNANTTIKWKREPKLHADIRLPLSWFRKCLCFKVLIKNVLNTIFKFAEGELTQPQNIFKLSWQGQVIVRFKDNWYYWGRPLPTHTQFCSYKVIICLQGEKMTAIQSDGGRVYMKWGGRSEKKHIRMKSEYFVDLVFVP